MSETILDRGNPLYFLSDEAAHDPTPLTHGQSPRPILEIDYDGFEIHRDNSGRIHDRKSIVKHDDCAHYDECLDHAACMDWTQFSCDSCDTYDQLPRMSVVQIGLRRQDPLDFVYEVGCGGDHAREPDAPER